MNKNRVVYIRVTKDQHQRFRENANAKGFKTISAYVRTAVLENDLILQEKITKIYNKIVDEGKDDSIKNKKLIEFC